MIDTKLIAAHQWVVDETQKKPGWWAEHAIMAGTVLDLIRQVLTWEGGWDAVVMLVCLVSATMFVRATKNEMLLKSIGESKWIRNFFIGLIIFQFFMLFTTKQVGIEILGTCAAIFVLSFYCFAACDAPRPKKRKEKLVLRMA